METALRRPRAHRGLAVAVALLGACAAPAQVDVVRIVRNKISAGDLMSATAAAEDYRAAAGRDVKYYEAVGWLARGAEMMEKPEQAQRFVDELRRAIPTESQETLTAYGAAIEVEGRILAKRDGVPAALAFWKSELGRAQDVSLRSRIWKNINKASIEGRLAPEIAGAGGVGPPAPSLASLRGKPVLMFFWAHDCGDCRAQSRVLQRIWKKYASRGLEMIAPTRLYALDAAGKPLRADAERAAIAETWAEAYAGLERVPVPIDTETLVRYGVSATPTFVCIDRRGRVVLYSPTRMPESELEEAVERVMESKEE